MRQTISEKIISMHAKKPVKAGDYALVNVDLCLLQDGTGPLAVAKLKELGIKKPKSAKKTVVFLDHAAPSPRFELSNAHNVLRKFAAETGAILSDINEGVCHQIMAERFVCPGDVVIGADSHTCTAGALCAFSTGMGSTDVAAAIGLGKTWLWVPETFRIIADGRFKKGVYSKDLMLYLIGKIGADGATYKALEFEGEAIRKMTMSERLTLTNMAIEAGAKTGLIASDDITRKYLKENNRAGCFKKIKADKGANYQRTIKADVSKLVPMVALPHNVDNVKPINKIGKVEIDQVFIGSCTNARIQDLRIVAKIWKKGRKSPKTRVIITPCSKTVYLQAVKEGLIDEFIKFGAAVNNPGCGACVGVHGGILGDGERCLATINRNFMGRMGNPKAFVYLGSPATAAATAIEGKIADPRKYL